MNVARAVFPPLLSDLFRRISMPVKASMAGLLLGLLLLVGLEALRVPVLKSMLSDHLTAHLEDEATRNRFLFDRYVKQHGRVVQLLGRHEPLITWLQQNPEQTSEIRRFRQRPPWFPPVSAWRGLIDPEYVLLLDSKARVKAGYPVRGHEIPASLLNMNGLLVARSQNQPYLTSVEGHPYLLASTSVTDAQGLTLGTLVLITALNDRFLTKLSFGTLFGGTILGLLEGEEQHVKASGEPERLPANALAENLRQDYVVSGKLFFDYGDSDLRLQLATFVPKAYTQAILDHLLTWDRRQQLIVSAAFIGAFTILMVLLSQRVNQLIGRLSTFAQEALGSSQVVSPGGDQLVRLEAQIGLLINEVLAGREALRLRYEMTQKAKQLEVLEAVSEHLGVGVVFSDGPSGKPQSNERMLAFEAQYGKRWYAGRQGEVKFKNKHQEWRIFYVSRLSLSKPDDVVLAQDLTEQKHAEAILRESEEKFRNITESTKDAIISIDSHGNVVSWNGAAAKAFGYFESEMLGTPLRKVIPAEYREAHAAALRRVAGVEPSRMQGKCHEFEGLRKDGARFPLELSVSSWRQRGQQFFTGIIRDISDRRAAERQARERQALLERIIENVPHSIFWKGRQSVYLGCNRKFAQQAGLESPEAIVGKTDYDLAWKKEESDDYRKIDREVMESDEPQLNIEEPQRQADGTAATLLTSKVPLHDDSGQVSGILGIYTEITERKRAEEALKATTTELEAIYRALPDLLFRLGGDGTVLAYHRGTQSPDLYVPPEKFLGRRIQAVRPPEVGGAFTDVLARLARAKEVVAFEYRLPMSDGMRDFEARLVPLREEEILVLIRDVSVRKQAETHLAEREAQLRLILASTGEGIFGIDQHGRCLFANRACTKMLGYTDESFLLGQRMHGLTHHTRADGSPYPVEACPTYATCRTGKRTRAEGELLWRADGSAFPADYQSHPMVQDGEVVGAVITFSDMTERLEARDALRRERDFAESLIATAPVIILVLDPEGRIVRFNPFMAELTGYRLEEVQGKDWFTTFLPEHERARIQAVFQDSISDTPTRGNVNAILTRGGEERLIAWHDKTLKDAEGQIIGCLAIGHNITAEKEREAQLFQAQKMEVIGRLTGGIAHDFNNLLTVILGNLELIKEQLPPDGMLRGFAEDAQSAARDGAALTRRLLGFARKTPLQPALLALQDFLPHFERLLRPMVTEAITLEVRCNTAIPPLHVDRVQLESALLNLAINAQDAMPNGGRLRITARGLEVAAEGHTDYPTLTPGDYVVISVRDTGTGMSATQLARATEPFYTTKATGKGSGLGLTLVYGFARDSGGALRLSSELAEGTEVCLVLPVAHHQLEPHPHAMAPTDLTQGTGTVLLVEDETRVRKLAKQYLSAAGYTVVEAETGDAALAMIQSGTAPDLLFSDIALPGTLNGYALACRVVQDYPTVKVLLTTGADTDKLAGSGIDTERFPLLRKPYSAAALAEAAAGLLPPLAD